MDDLFILMLSGIFVLTLGVSIGEDLAGEPSRVCEAQQGKGE